jgi:signal transduction histidine kinase
MRGKPLRRRLVLVAVAAIVPLAATAGLALLALGEQQRVQAERAGLEVTRALATAVDAELRRSVAALQAMSASPSLDTSDLERFHEQMRRVHADRPYWVTVTLADPQGLQLANATQPFGEALPPVADPESLQRVVRSRRPSVGALSAGPRGVRAVPVRVPVVREGEVRFVLSAALKPDGFLQVLELQRLPADWVISVFDASDARVARSRQHAQYLAQPPAPSLAALMQRGDEGAGMTRALEGEEVYTAFTRSGESGWTVAIGIPRAVVEAGALRSFLVYGGGILLSIALGVAAALAVGRGITTPMEWLRVAAQALGRRETVVPPQTPILEIREVGNALAAAAEEHARYEAERELLLRREREARSAAEATSRAKDEFLAMLGHELRNPLGAIAIASQLLEDPRTGPEGARLAREVVRRQVQHLSRLTDDLLDAGRAVMGKIFLERQPLELAALVSRALATLEATGRLAEHRIERDLAPVWVDADHTRMEQILANLVGNAVKFTPAGGSITVRVTQEGGEALLAVRDNGVGMTPELRARAFDLFVQGEAPLDRGKGGLGIGLTLVRRLAELHGGVITAESGGPGYGSEFTVRLPAIAAPQITTTRRGENAARTPRDVLIVEDNADAAQTLRAMLELWGHRVSIARDGVAGLEALQQQPPEVALIDIGLPRMDGYELAQRARSAAPGERRPLLVALTGYGLPEDRERALAAGFDEHLVKPVSPAALNSVLARAS